MAQETTTTEAPIDVSPEARQTAIALAASVRAAVREVEPDGEPAAFGLVLRRLAAAGDKA